MDENMSVGSPAADNPITKADAAYRSFPPFGKWSKARTNPELWQRYQSGLQQEKDQVSKESLTRAVNTAIRSAALDTGAIEGLYSVDRGFTLTVATQATAWQAALDQKGPLVREFFEAQLQAFEVVLDAATSSKPISEAMIRRVHEVLCAPQKTYEVRTPVGMQKHSLPKGEYKKHPNHVELPDGSVHAYAPVSATSEEMNRLVRELRTSEFEAADSVIQASYAHYGLAAIHPFADGNGRVARALASVFLYRSTSIPLVIFADQQVEYLQTLRAADDGDFQPFIDFIFARGLDTMADMTQELRTARVPAIDESIKTIRNLLTGHGGLLHHELDAVGIRLLEMLNSEFVNQIGKLDLPTGVRVVTSIGTRAAADITEYRPIISGGSRFVEVQFRADAPAAANLSLAFEVLIAKGRQETFALLARNVEEDDSVSIRLSDIYPAESIALKTRLSSWVRGWIAKGLAKLTELADESFRGSGYLGSTSS